VVGTNACPQHPVEKDEQGLAAGRAQVEVEPVADRLKDDQRVIDAGGFERCCKLDGLF
jgi:hypothetical protein